MLIAKKSGKFRIGRSTHRYPQILPCKTMMGDLHATTPFSTKDKGDSGQVVTYRGRQRPKA